MQLRKAAEQAAQVPEDDKAASARLEKEIRDEEQAIRKLCDDLGVQMHEVSNININRLSVITVRSFALDQS